MNPQEDDKKQENAVDQEEKADAQVRDLEPEKDPAGGAIKGAPQTIVNNTPSALPPRP